jgi:hypothetical protein
VVVTPEELTYPAGTGFYFYANNHAE